jgi:hypothetical protein
MPWMRHLRARALIARRVLAHSGRHEGAASEALGRLSDAARVSRIREDQTKPTTQYRRLVEVHAKRRSRGGSAAPPAETSDVVLIDDLCTPRLRNVA